MTGERSKMRRTSTAGILLLLFLVPGPHWSQAAAQSGLDRNVAVLPFLSSIQDSSFAAEYSAAFRSGIRQGSWLRLVGPVDGEERVGLSGLRRTLDSPRTLREYLTSASSSFLITGVMTRVPGGGIQVSSIVYSRDEGAVVGMERRDYPDEVSAREDASRLGSDLSHPSRFVTGDTAFFYSMILPGAGQLSMGRWKWALGSVGLLTGTVLYRNSLPDGDPFRFDPSRFQQVRETTDGRWYYRYYVDDVEVSWEAYEQEMKEDRARSSYAYLERRRAGARKSEASLYILGAYVFNIMNTLFLSRRSADGQSFFTLVRSLEETPAGPSLTTGLQLRFPISP